MKKVIMIQGTMSNVGKTLITAGLCRVFHQDGYSVAPFKSQNMSLNSFTTEDGLEMARAQMVQAEAAGILPSVLMNPILLKPISDEGSQVIVNGKLRGNMKAAEYFAYRSTLAEDIKRAFNTLASRYDIIVIEGAGSPVELNLNRDDMINMGVAIKVKAPVVIVSDIDRGGIFASLYGTVRLLKETERMHVKALIVNRFKGELSFFTDGAEILERITGIPVAGVIPYRKIDLPEEDSLYGGGTPFGKKADFENQFNSIADNVRKSLNMDLIYKIINEGIKQ